MLGKRCQPVTGKLTGSGRRAGFSGAATSPKSPLELKNQSPRGLKDYDVGGVGLGIVAALEKSGDSGGEIRARYAVCSLSLNRSNPIPVNSAKNSAKFTGGYRGSEMGSLENYTRVTCHGPNRSITRVYCDGTECGGCRHDRNGFDRRQKNLGLFNESPARFTEDIPAFPTSDFLSSCNWCRKQLHGKDIYMYRGEKAFCSTECRYRQIVIDERKERCRSEASRSADISNSPYATGQIFSTGIVAI